MMNTQQPQPLKLVFRGRLDFGSQRTYDLVLKHWQSRCENYFKAEVMQPDDNPPIGILLCTEKGDTLVRYATAGLDPNIFVQKYKIQLLSSEEEIKRFLSKETG